MRKAHQSSEKYRHNVNPTLQQRQRCYESAQTPRRLDPRNYCGSAEKPITLTCALHAFAVLPHVGTPCNCIFRAYRSGGGEPCRSSPLWLELPARPAWRIHQRARLPQKRGIFAKVGLTAWSASFLSLEMHGKLLLTCQANSRRVALAEECAPKQWATSFVSRIWIDNVAAELLKAASFGS